MSSADTAPSAAPSFSSAGAGTACDACRPHAPQPVRRWSDIGSTSSAGWWRRGGSRAKCLSLDLRTGRWSFAPRSSPAEHLAVTAAGGSVYALAGRSGGTNFTTFEAYSPARRDWRPLPPVPYPRGEQEQRS